MEEKKKYIKLTDPDILSAPDPNVPGMEETFACKMAHHFRVDVAEKQDELIMAAIKQIGGDTYQDITIDKSKVIEALGKYVAKRTTIEVVDGDAEFPQTLIIHHCPTCNLSVLSFHGEHGKDSDWITKYKAEYKYCRFCGQHLDWTDDGEAEDEEVCND